jgi:ElaB/YqjD/DUF883 family membrane-anchored ribosome-binding protein
MGQRATEVDRPLAGPPEQRGRPPETPYSAAGKDPEQIRADIARTRAELGDTIDRLQERLNPRRLRDEAQDAVREATIGRAKQMAEKAGHRARGFRDVAMDTIRQNPIPAAMVALGLGWLIVEGPGRGREVRTYDVAYGPPVHRAEEYPRISRPTRVTVGGEHHAERGESMTEEARRRATEASGEVRERAERLADQARETAERVGEQARETVGQVQEQTRDTMEQVRSTASHAIAEGQEQLEHVASRAQEQFQRVQGRASRLMDESPLAVGAIALAAGALVGLAIPETPQEDRLLGESRDKLMDRAREQVEDTAQRVREVASEAGQAAQEAAEGKAKEQGLTS